MKHKKQEALKTPPKRTTKLIVLLCLSVLVVFFWLFLNAHLEHRNRHYVEDSQKLRELEIVELEEVVRKDPHNYSAWLLLGSKHRQDKNNAKAKESWDKALKVAHTKDEAAWLKNKLSHINENHKKHKE